MTLRRGGPRRPGYLEVVTATREWKNEFSPIRLSVAAPPGARLLAPLLCASPPPTPPTPPPAPALGLGEGVSHCGHGTAGPCQMPFSKSASTASQNAHLLFLTVGADRTVPRTAKQHRRSPTARAPPTGCRRGLTHPLCALLFGGLVEHPEREMRLA